jgi:hypothetical protein
MNPSNAGLVEERKVKERGSRRKNFGEVEQPDGGFRGRKNPEGGQTRSILPLVLRKNREKGEIVTLKGICTQEYSNQVRNRLYPLGLHVVNGTLIVKKQRLTENFI